MTDLGNKIKELRNEKRLTQKEMAGRLNISVSTLSHWECNYQEPSIKDLVVLSKFFDVSVDELLEVNESSMTSAARFSGDAYSADERRFVEGLRKLTPNMREILRTTLDAMIEEK